MIINIHGKQVDVKFTVGLIADIVHYKKRFENSNVTITRYFKDIESGEGALDVIVDAVYYSHVIACRNKGLKEAFTYGDALAWALANPEDVQELMDEFSNSMPKPDGQEDEGAKKKAK